MNIPTSTTPIAMLVTQADGSRKLTLYLPIRPMPLQSVRTNRKNHFWQPQKATQYKRDIIRLACAAVNSCCPHALKMKYAERTVMAEAWFIYKLPKKDKEYREMLILNGGLVYKRTRPDADNLGKPFWDALNGVFWEDDALVADQITHKRWGLQDCIICTIEELSWWDEHNPLGEQ